MTNSSLDIFELPSFSSIKPEDIAPAVNKVIGQNRSELDQLLDMQLAGTRQPDFGESIATLEEISDRIHKVWSPVSHLHGVLNSPELREAYNSCLPILSRYQSELSQDKRLFNLYQQLADKLANSPESPEKSLIRHALLEFHLGGIDLPDLQQARLREIREEMTQLQAAFEQNLLDSMAAWQYHTNDAAALKGLPDSTMEAAKQAAIADDKQGWLLGLDQPNYMAVMTYAEDPALREFFYKGWCTRASSQGPLGSKFDNTENMERILRLRQEVAKLVGYSNYAEYALASRMASSVEEVSNFLHELADVSAPAAKRELAELESYAGRSLHPWDMAYYSEQLRLERFSISDEELRPYFPLNSVLKGFFGLIENLYGLTLRPESNVDVWHNDADFYSLRNRDGKLVGGVFVDLYARRNKRAGAWMDECQIRKQLNGKLQSPIAHLVCNFAAPLNDAPALLTHDDVVTLFHEFGHTLHHLLTTIDYPSISGINGVPWDAVELPSQFMENFAWNTDVVRNISEHYQTGAPLPDQLLAKLEASRVFQSGMQMARQLEFSLFDWYLHSEYDPECNDAATLAMQKARNDVAVYKVPAYNRMAHGFAHVYSGGYGAGYYSYKWAEVLAADAFSAFEEQGLHNPDLAAKFRRDILEIGGSKDIAEAFETFRGRPPSNHALLVQSGITPNN
ncbi:MAG: M3 family metallopeptidase [Gammaproteobacteria bacterium]|nr:M3 family metallopeptidase [Gammaproteobacteria bacterium]